MSRCDLGKAAPMAMCTAGVAAKASCDIAAGQEQGVRVWSHERQQSRDAGGCSKIGNLNRIVCVVIVAVASATSAMAAEAPAPGPASASLAVSPAVEAILGASLLSFFAFYLK
ncbi:hypothetical protein ZIOFF_024553 [Zingiber officinale]|uniref:Uncharacterized protein n=1 Tax=Zingiber officinale TaxID=94328 RepID=A0A8J5GTR7_ZINOF|nr:hypothetical protein ZIOFF_024553 [Zingiber officinale]